MYDFGCFNILNPEVKYISYKELSSISSDSFIFILHCHILAEICLYQKFSEHTHG